VMVVFVCVNVNDLGSRGKRSHSNVCFPRCHVVIKTRVFSSPVQWPN
jgi:hypothetical protein